MHDVAPAEYSTFEILDQKQFTNEVWNIFKKSILHIFILSKNMYKLGRYTWHNMEVYIDNLYQLFPSFWLRLYILIIIASSCCHLAQPYT